MTYHKLLFAVSTVLLTMNSVHAAGTPNLNTYSVSAIYDLDILNGTNGGISGLEASAVTYAADRNSLFIVGDEGTGVVETSLTGQTLGYMNFNWDGTGSTKHDTEGLTYIGNGKLVVSEERLQDAYQFDYQDKGTATLADNFVSMSNTEVKNSGIEGISYDQRNGSFVTIKQDSPEAVYSGTLSFSAATGGLPSDLPKQGQSPNGGGTSTMLEAFDPTALGLSTLSDVQTLGILDSDDLLILSLGSRKLVTVDRSGHLLSSLDLSMILANNGIEGVTIDANGTIYLVAEQLQDEFALGGDMSKLIVLSSNISAVPIPAAAFLFTPALVGFMGLRRKTKTV
ncbi:hypothetical protein LCGC14_1246340 [marine sediment metagenome]|uniref:Phytase-like domain-containing protein n=1 Tax=marine sediment metagenome TaxID=412755 RepID=A0A0F9L866_9ZZZZ